MKDWFPRTQVAVALVALFLVCWLQICYFRQLVFTLIDPAIPPPSNAKLIRQAILLGEFAHYVWYALLLIIALTAYVCWKPQSWAARGLVILVECAFLFAGAYLLIYLMRPYPIKFETWSRWERKDGKWVEPAVPPRPVRPSGKPSNPVK